MPTNLTTAVEDIEALRRQCVTDRDTVDAIVARWSNIDLAPLLSAVTAEGALPGEARRYAARIHPTASGMRTEAADLNESLYRIRDTLALICGLVEEARAHRSR